MDTTKQIVLEKGYEVHGTVRGHQRLIQQELMI